MACRGLAREVFADPYARLQSCEERIGEYDRRVAELARCSEAAQRLMQVEGVGCMCRPNSAAICRGAERQAHATRCSTNG